MAERSWIVGNSPECDIRVENAAVSARHCQLTQRGESLLLEDLGSTNGTYVAGERISGPRIVRRGDPVTLGRSTPLPWPPMVYTVTIGRLPDNDIVIPLDMISGHHARLEREGDTVYLIDIGSTNGIAVNEALNKVARTAIQPTDQVFFGTHRVTAWELLKALPKQADRHSTALESNAGSELERELASDGALSDRRQAAALSPSARFASRSSWAWGIGLSALCAALILGTSWIHHSGSPTLADDTAAKGEGDFDVASPPDGSSPGKLHGHRPNADGRRPVEPAAKSPRAEANETPVETGRATASVVAPVPNLPAAALGLVGIRAGDTLIITPTTVWAFRPDAVICPTADLELLETRLKTNKQKYKDLDAALVVCTPHKTLAILEHQAGHGPAEGFSFAKLEAPVEVAATIATSNSPPPVPEQSLTMLSCHCEQLDKSETIVAKPHALKIARIGRADDKSPSLFHCTGDAILGDVQGSPVFDAAGSIVGCARASAGDVEVVPISQLAELLSLKP